MDISSKTAMELHFAEHFDTVLFPVLADHYIQDGDPDRARKVIKIGLEYHPEHPDGLYLLAEIERSENNFTGAEKYLKEVLKKGIMHLQAAISLAEVQTELERAKATITKSWKKVLIIDPGNTKALIALGQVERKKKLQPGEEQEKTGKPESKLSQSDDGFSISPRLATFTMVAVLRNQGLHHQALDVLNILERNGADQIRITSERQSILETLETS